MLMGGKDVDSSSHDKEYDLMPPMRENNFKEVCISKCLQFPITLLILKICLSSLYIMTKLIL